MNKKQDMEKWLTERINAFMSSPINDMGMPDGPEPAFAMPLVAFSKGDDSLWLDFKVHVGDFHWTPEEAFRKAYPENPTEASNLSVLSWVLPQTGKTVRDHAKCKAMPSERWSRNRNIGEENVHFALHKFMLDELCQKGIRAISPIFLPEFSWVSSEKFQIASQWSERHAAFVAGLGTFGLCDGLITAAGKAMRTGSIVLEYKLAATKRPYTSHHEYCLFFNNNGKCQACIKHCPAGAISPAGHNKTICKNYLLEQTNPYVEKQWGLPGRSCGLCQVGVPCATGIPERRESH